MATVVLLRHGRTTANAAGVLAGDGEMELDSRGIEQARAVGDLLRGVAAKEVVTSPLRRCVQTLELALPDARPVVEAGLTECGYGEWTGRSLRELSKNPLWPVVQQHPSAAVFPGGEAMAAMAARAVAAVREWDRRVESEHGPGAVWLACSHGDVIKAIVADALGLHLDQFQRIVVDPASLSVIRYTPFRPFLVRLNDAAWDLAAALAPPPGRAHRRRSRHGGAGGDAAVGGGAGPAGRVAGGSARARRGG